MKNVLITGMSGLVGGVLEANLRDDYRLSALNRRPLPGRATQADIHDLQAIRPAFSRQDVVIHLAARATIDVGWEDILHDNIEGTYNVFEAAREAGVRRIVYASSGAITSGWERDEPYNALVQGRYADVPDTWPMISQATAPRPMGLYGCSKLWGEVLARHFVDTSSLSILCIRIGVVNRENRPMTARDYSGWLSHGDLVRAVRCCLDASDELDFGVFYAVSNNRWNYRDLQHARDLVGFVPRDNAESLRPD